MAGSTGSGVNGSMGITLCLSSNLLTLARVFYNIMKKRQPRMGPAEYSGAQSPEAQRMKSSDRETVEGILFTDQYQLTMAQVYYRMGLHEQHVQFDHYFRHYPDYGTHKAGYCVNAGLGWLLDWMQEAHFRDKDIEYLRGQRNSTGTPVFDEGFLKWLGDNCNFGGLSMQTIPEGR